MGLLCANCNYDNDPTRVYCHSCGTRLERGGQAAPPPTGFTHPTDVLKMKKPRQPVDWAKYLGALLRLFVLGGLVAAVVLALLPPRDLPAPVDSDRMLAQRLSSLVAASAGAGGIRAFSVPAGDINRWLVSSVALKEQEGIYNLKPERVYAVPGDGDVRVGVETKLPMGLNLYFEGNFAPVPEGNGCGVEARGYSIGRLPLPSVAGVLVQRQFDNLAEALAVPLGQLASASHIGITPEQVTLRWSGGSR
jgi:hypothetical protein